MSHPALISLTLAAGFAAAQDPDLVPAVPAALPAPATWFDVDADGLADALALSPEGGLRLMRNLGDGSFADVTEAAGLAAGGRGAVFARWGDLDADGHGDLFVGTSQGAPLLFRNRGDGTFFECAADLGLDHAGRDLDAQWTDYDGDGALDLVAWTAAGALGYHNVGGSFERVDLGLAPFPVGVGGAAVFGGDGGGIGNATAAGAADRDGRRSGGSGAGGTAGLGASGPGVSATRGPAGTAALGTGICVDGLFDQAGGGCIAASTSPTLGSLYPLSADLFVDAAGSVGVGTTFPTSRLHVNGSIRGNDIMMAPFGTGANPSYRFGAGSEDTGISSPSFESLAFTTDAIERVRIDSVGNVGIGDTFPAATLTVGAGGKFRVDGTDGAVTLVDDNASLYFPDTDGTNEPMMHMFASSTSNGNRMVVAHSPSFTDWGMRYVDQGDRFEFISAGVPRVTMNLAFGPWLDVHGTMRTDTLQIDGGADLVELFDTGAETCEPGTVVVIDPENAGQLATSDEAYDRRVAGIVSGANGLNPGLQLGQDGVADGDTRVAMTGRVFVKASAENGPIAPGDLLTTAGTRGHAMRADDPDRAFGAVIGKAMGALDEGTGLVLVLVNLQ